MEMRATNSWDAFLCHSSKDKDVVREIERCLSRDGLRVWFDEEKIDVGDSIPRKIDEGLERSRVLVFFMSANSFGADWPMLELYARRFLDPLNKERRFIPVRLDETPIKGSLAHFRHINWARDRRDEAYQELLDCCRPTTADKFHERCMNLLYNTPASERTVVDGLLREIDSYVEHQPFERERLLGAIQKATAALTAERPTYSLLSEVRSAFNECLSDPSSTAAQLRKCMNRLRRDLSDALDLLAARGAHYIEDGDSLLLYAHSESVHAVINKWLRDNPRGTLILVFCECLGKVPRRDRPFCHAQASADQIIGSNARIYFVRDSAIGGMISSHRITKVFLGAHQWSWRSYRHAWFTNTQGSMSIATSATRFGVPIFVLVEERKIPRSLPASAHGVRSNPQLFSETELPEKTRHGLMIEYEEIGNDLVDSKDIPFVLITEKGDFTCADHDLRKRNSVALLPGGLSVRKTTNNRLAARSERAVLEALNVGGQKLPKFQVPPPLVDAEDRLPWAAVLMRRKAGVRMHDLLATLNVVARTRGRKLSQRADTFRKKVCGWAIDDVRTWQSVEIQKVLRERFGTDAKKYDFAGKFEEALSYVAGLLADTTPPDQALLREVEQLATRLAARADVFLRDANLKNQILELRGLLGVGLPERCKSPGYYPFVDNQWFDPPIVEALLSRVPNEIRWSAVRRNIWQIDFELSSYQTTRDDDFVHVLTAEVFSFEYDKIVRVILRQLRSAVTAEQVHETILFRSFRAWARRLFYHHELPEVFATRYRHETLAHYYELARTAARKLSLAVGGNLLAFIERVGQRL